MGRFSSDSGSGAFVSAPVGTHVARCIKLIDLGTQHGEYMGQPTRRNQVLIVWELPDETMEFDGEQKPITTSRFYTNSLSDKANMRRDLESWRGRSFTEAELGKFDLETILGVPCLLTIVGGENGKTKVATVSGLPKGMQCPPQVNKSFSFWLDEFDQAKFEELSEGIRKIVEKSEEYDRIQHGPRSPQSQPVNDDDDPDSIPF
jgi:hypothetical protein